MTDELHAEHGLEREIQAEHETQTEHEGRLDYPEHDRSYALFGKVILIGANVMATIVILGIVLAH